MIEHAKTKGTHLNFAISRSKRAIRFGVASSGIVGTASFLGTSVHVDHCHVGTPFRSDDVKAQKRCSTTVAPRLMMRTSARSARFQGVGCTCNVLVVSICNQSMHRIG